MQSPGPFQVPRRLVFFIWPGMLTDKASIGYPRPDEDNHWEHHKRAAAPIHMGMHCKAVFEDAGCYVTNRLPLHVGTQE